MAFEVSVSKALLEDRPLLRDFECRIHLESTAYSPGALAAQLADLPTDFPPLFSDDAFRRAAVFAARDAGGLLVGAAGLAFEADPPGAELLFLSVHPSARQRGVAQELVKAALAEAERRGCSKIKLLTLLGILEPACRLYEKLGFQLVSSKVVEWYHLGFYEMELGRPEVLPPCSFTSLGDSLKPYGSEGTAAVAVWEWEGRAAAIEKGIAGAQSRAATAGDGGEEVDTEGATAAAAVTVESAASGLSKPC